MSSIRDPEAVLKLDTSFARACLTDQDFSLSDPVGQRFDAWFGGQEWLKSQNVVKGTTFYRNCGDVHIFYLIIKEHNYSQATIENITSSLNNMLTQTAGHSIEKIAFSKITLPELTKVTLQALLDGLGSTVNFFVV